MSASKKSILLQPNRNIVWPWWIIGLLISMVSIGLVALFFIVWVLLLIPVYVLLLVLWHRKWKKIAYIITDHHITIQDGTQELTLPIAELEQIDYHHLWVPFSVGIGHIDLTWQQKKYRLQRLADARTLYELIQKSSSYLKHQATLAKPKVELTNLPKAGTLEHLNDLVGLWQQGLLSDEAFEQEKKRLM